MITPEINNAERSRYTDSQKVIKWIVDTTEIEPQIGNNPTFETMSLMRLIMRIKINKIQVTGIHLLPTESHFEHIQSIFSIFLVVSWATRFF